MPLYAARILLTAVQQLTALTALAEAACWPLSSWNKGSTLRPRAARAVQLVVQCGEVTDEACREPAHTRTGEQPVARPHRAEGGERTSPLDGISE